MEKEQALLREGQHDRQIDDTAAKHFLQALDSTGGFTFQTFDDRTPKNPSLSKILHGTFDQHREELTRLNKAGAGVFVTVNTMDGRGRTRENVTGIRAVFLDLDGAPLPTEWPIKPHLIIQSSPGKWHAYWLVEPGFPMDRFTATQKTIAGMFDGDQAVSDLPRVMRIPGFIHQKNDPFLSEMILDWSSDPRYTTAQIIEAFTPTAATKPTTTTEDPLLRLLNDKAMVIRQERAEKGKFIIKCPWAGQHTNGDPEAAYWQAHTGGQARAGFKCLHSHCVGKTIKDLKTFLGLGAEAGIRGDLARLTKNEADIGGSLVQDELGIAEMLDSGENLLFTQNRFWGFSETGGIWTEFPDEYVKREIQKVCRNNRLNVKDSFIRGSFNCAKARFFRPVQFDQIDKRSIGASNGVLQYVEGEWKLSPYRREDYRRIRLPVEFDPTAECPRFEQFLSEVFEGTPDKHERALTILEFLGLSMTANMEFEKALLLVGKGGNGKSVLFRTLEALVGVKNRSSVQMKQLENRFQRAHLDGKLVNLMEELSEGAEVPDAELKAIITGASITAEHKLRPPFEFDPICKLWISTNHMPGVRDLSDGIFRRFTVLSFPVRFDDKPNRDTRLSEKLAAETSGILNYCLKALAGVYERGNLTNPASSKLALLAWQKDSDQTSMFLEEEMIVEPGAFISSGDAYAHYVEWAKGAGIKRTLGRKTFTERLENHGIERGKGTGGVRMLYGLRCR